MKYLFYKNNAEKNGTFRIQTNAQDLPDVIAKVMQKFKGTLMQILKSPNIFAFIGK